MNYSAEFTEAAKRELKKLDKYTAAMILGWIRKNLEGCENPRRHGKELTANSGGQWCYRIGDYRILAEIQESRILILVLNVGHRRCIWQ